MNITTYGDHALRFEVGELREVHKVAAAIKSLAIKGVLDIVPSWTSVLVTLDTGVDRSTMIRRLYAIDTSETPQSARRHVLAVAYDGEDLPRVAASSGLSVNEVIERHSQPDYLVAFLGFTPGFPYLAGLDPALSTPRHDTPRLRVAAGSVGIADGVSGIYPSVSPGGWNIVGHIRDVLFDVSADPPARLTPGDSVRFEPG